METFTMNRKERARLETLGRVGRGEVTLAMAGELLDLSYRQIKRVYARYQAEGDRGLVHRLRGRASNRQPDARTKARVLELYQEHDADFGPTLAAEYLNEEDGLVVGVETLRRWLLAAGLWQKRRRRKAHRRWRRRKEHRGQMVQMDGSHHDWFEGRRGWAVLMVRIDDATNWIYARFFEGETTAAAMETFGRYVEQRGLPRSLYVDRHSIYESTQDASMSKELAGTGPLTQFTRAMRELDVKLILAGSPQAKGRVERQNGMLQDRLVKAMRRAKIKDLASANEFLEKDFLSKHNHRFAIEPARKADVHRRLPRGVKLARVLSFQELRVVQNDWTVRWRNRWFQLTSANRKLSLAGCRVRVCEPLDGTILLLYRNRELSLQELPERPSPTSQRKPCGLEIRSSQGHRPSANHPWRGSKAVDSAAAAELAPEVTLRFRTQKGHTKYVMESGRFEVGEKSGEIHRRSGKPTIGFYAVGVP